MVKNAEFLKKDIELAIELGFNGARLHQRVFEERTLYYADKLGYMLWAEAPSGIDLMNPRATELFIPEWLEIFNSYYNHPSIVGWCPFNETFNEQAFYAEPRVVLYQLTKALEPYRPVIDASGGIHCATDMYDVHEYEQNPDALKKFLEPMLQDPTYYHNQYGGANEEKPKGIAYWVSEYGGTFWNPNGSGWGYGSTPQAEEEFADRYEGLTDALLSHPRVCGFCYTQLTDIEQEQNGLFFYDRTKKFSESVYKRIRNINVKKAAMEE